MDQIKHATLVLERTYKAAPARVFAAWESVEARERWSAPGEGIQIKYEAADFREGGQDRARCIEPGVADYEAGTIYLEIKPGRRIVFSERVAQAGTNLSAALISVELEAAGSGTRQLVTIQIAAFNDEMAAGYEFGWSAAIDNLAKEFEQ